MLTALLILLAAAVAIALAPNDRRRLGGWTRTGNRASHGQETPLLPGGGIDWSRPRCEPDNSLRAIAGRLAEIVLPLAGGLPVALGGLWLVNQPAAHNAAAPIIEAMPGGWVAGGIQAGVLFVVGLLALSVGLPAWLRHQRSTAPRVDVTVTSRPMTGPMDLGIPRGQLVYRRFDSPALAAPAPALPPGPPSRPAALHTQHDTPAPVVDAPTTPERKSA